MAATTVGLGLLAPSARAALIPGVTATTDMGSFIPGNIANTVNGIGLPSNTPALAGNHQTADPGNSWGSVIALPGLVFGISISTIQPVFAGSRYRVPLTG
jgi:hypothetical protein